MGCANSTDVKNNNLSSPALEPKHDRRNSTTQLVGYGKSNFILENHGIVTNFYELRDALGQGAFGTVTIAISKATKQKVALKSISKMTLNSREVEKIKKEVLIMKELDHPNIAKLYETIEDHKNVYLAMELCTGGELFDQIIKETHLSESVAVHIMSQVLRGIYYMHDHHICHRDLKPENFLLAAPSELKTCTIKIIDFGMSKYYTPGQPMKTRAGTPYYVAPQVLNGKYDEKSDVWSAGVIAYILLCGYPPFNGSDDKEILKSVRSGQINFPNKHWSCVSDLAKTFIKDCVAYEPSTRLSAKDALSHSWIKNKENLPNAPLHSSIIENISAFRSRNKLKKAAMQVIATLLPDSEILNLRNIFTTLDKNGDGILTRAEIAEGIKSTGLDLPEDFMEMITSIDTDQSGVIDYTEFIAATLDRHKVMKEDRVWAAFRVFDSDGNGEITRDELAAVLNKGDLNDLLSGDIDDILKECDKNGDGKIDFREFMDMMASE